MHIHILTSKDVFLVQSFDRMVDLKKNLDHCNELIKLIKSFASLNDHSLTLSYCDTDEDGLDKQIIILSIILPHIPQNITTLKLSRFSFAKIFKEKKGSHEKVIGAFSLIPNHIRHLYLSNILLGSLDTETLVKIFSHFPKNIQSLDLSENNLFLNRSIQERDKIISATFEKKANWKRNGETIESIILSAILSITSSKITLCYDTIGVIWSYLSKKEFNKIYGKYHHLLFSAKLRKTKSLKNFSSPKISRSV